MKSPAMPIKIKTYKVHQSGRGVVLTLPAVWADDLGLCPGDRLDVYRDAGDRLIIVPAKKEVGRISENPVSE
jgi:AbrB family looped-hinge helix DNA binding protein